MTLRMLDFSEYRNKNTKQLYIRKGGDKEMKSYGLLWLFLLGLLVIGMVSCVAELALFVHGFGGVTLP